MDSIKEFHETIFRHYLPIVKDKMTIELLKEVCSSIADYYFEQYSRFTIQYPKSRKRYSTFKVIDLEHPWTYEIIIKFFKEKFGDKYSDHAKALLQITDTELKNFEKSREEFHKMF